MYARISTMRVLEGEFGRILSFLREVVLPDTEMQKGFCGGILISDRSENKIVTVSWWDSQARLEATGRCAHLSEQITRLVLYLAELPKIDNYQLDALS